MVEVDEVEYRRGVEELKYSVVGRLALPRSSPLPNTMEVKIS